MAVLYSTLQTKHLMNSYREKTVCLNPPHHLLSSLCIPVSSVVGPRRTEKVLQHCNGVSPGAVRHRWSFLIVWLWALFHSVCIYKQGKIYSLSSHLPIAKKKLATLHMRQDSSFLSFRQTGEKEENQYKINIKPTVVRIEREKNHTSFFE